MNNWISVELALPQEYIPVLTYYNYDSIFGGTDSAICEDVFSEGEWSTENKVTHWMNLPSPPETK